MAMSNHPHSMGARYLVDLEWRICQASNIYVYRNGVENSTPILVHIPPANKRNMRSVLAIINERIKFPIGYAKTLYTMEGTKVRHPCELEMYNNYVVGSNYDKYFKCVYYGRCRSPLLVLNRYSKHIRVLRMNELDRRNNAARNREYNDYDDYDTRRGHFTCPVRVPVMMQPQPSGEDVPSSSGSRNMTQFSNSGSQASQRQAPSSTASKATMMSRPLTPIPEPVSSGADLPPPTPPEKQPSYGSKSKFIGQHQQEQLPADYTINTCLVYPRYLQASRYIEYSCFGERPCSPMYERPYSPMYERLRYPEFEPQPVVFEPPEPVDFEPQPVFEPQEPEQQELASYLPPPGLAPGVEVSSTTTFTSHSESLTDYEPEVETETEYDDEQYEVEYYQYDEYEGEGGGQHYEVHVGEETTYRSFSRHPQHRQYPPQSPE